VVDYEFVDGILVIYITKGVLAFTPDEVKIGLRRGERFKRKTALQMRLSAQWGASEFHQAPQAVDHARLALGRHERLPEREATTRAPAQRRAAWLYS
jgi:hypothetical protein